MCDSSYNMFTTLTLELLELLPYLVGSPLIKLGRQSFSLLTEWSRVRAYLWTLLL